MCPITKLCFYCHMCPSCPMWQANSKTFTASVPNFLRWSWWHVVLTFPEEGLLILYRSGIFAIYTSIVNCQTCPRHRDDLGVYWRTYRSPSRPAKTSKSYAKCSRLRDMQASTCTDFWLISITFLTVAAGKNLIAC